MQSELLPQFLVKFDHKVLLLWVATKCNLDWKFSHSFDAFRTQIFRLKFDVLDFVL